MNTDSNQKLVTTQLTAKRLKAQIMCAYTLSFVGVFMFFGACSVDESADTMAAIGGTLIGVGLPWLLITKFRIWWNHK